MYVPKLWITKSGQFHQGGILLFQRVHPAMTQINLLIQSDESIRRLFCGQPTIKCSQADRENSDQPVRFLLGAKF